MIYFLTKALVSGFIVALVSEIAKRSPTFGALVVSLPLISLLAIIWLWRDTGDATRVATHVQATFWYVLPSLPMFLVMPMMLRAGIGFWLSLVAACVITMMMYAITVLVAGKFGIRF